MAFLGPYYYGKHKWENYLLDIQHAVEAESSAQQQNIRLQAKALNSAQEQHLAELRLQTEQMHRIEDTLSQGFEGLRAEFEWGFTSIVDRMDTQIEQLSQIAARLDAIHKTLQSPLLTQARELFLLGQEHYRKRLLDKALETYLKAEQKNDVDFPLQFQIGKLFLYGRDEDDNVVDLPQAERHFLLAARYADAEKGTFPRWSECCGEAYFHAALAAYLIGEQEQAAGRADSRRACLERALGYLTKAEALWPRFTEIVYTQAKCHALLGQIQDSTQRFVILSDRDRRYFSKAAQDEDFQTFFPDVEELFKRAAISPGPLARATQEKLDEVSESIAWAKRSVPTLKEDLEMIESSERELAIANKSLPTLDVDIEGLNERLLWLRVELDKIAQRSFQNNLDIAQKSIAEMELRKSSCEMSIEQLKKTMKATSGAGVGWLVGVAALFIVPMFFAPFLVAIAAAMPEARTYLGAPGVIAEFVICIFAGIIASILRCSAKNHPYKLKIEENSRAIDESVRTLPSLRERAEAWQTQMRSFTDWQTQKPSTPPVPPSGRSGVSLTLTLISVGSNKIAVIKVIREVTGCGLKEAKDFVDNAPRPIKIIANRGELEEIKRKFLDAGARVEIE